MTPNETLDGANVLHTQATTDPNVEPRKGVKISRSLNQSPLTTLEGDEIGTKEKMFSQLEEFSPVEKPYSVFTRKEKWLIVGMTAIGGVFR